MLEFLKEYQIIGFIVGIAFQTIAYLVKRKIEKKSILENIDIVKGLEDIKSNGVKKSIINKYIKNSSPEIYEALIKDIQLNADKSQDNTSTIIESLKFVVMSNIRLLKTSTIIEKLLKIVKVEDGEIYKFTIENKEFALESIHSGYIILSWIKKYFKIKIDYLEFLDKHIKKVPLPKDIVSLNFIQKMKNEL